MQTQNQATLHLKPKVPFFDAEKALRLIQKDADWVGLRYTQEISHSRSARNEKIDSQSVEFSNGVMIEAMVDGQIAYSGTCDLSAEGIQQAMKKAVSLAKASAPMKCMSFSTDLRPKSTGKYQSPRSQGLDQTTLQDFTRFLIESTRHLKVSDQIVSADSSILISDVNTLYLTSNASHIEQSFLYISSNFSAIAKNGNETQKRTFSGPVARCHQIGTEVFDEDEIFVECERVGREALELTTAENCPTDAMDLILHPDQLYLQIHESIGHPLELDRILGDERNYAGWSFVKPTDFGTLKYGSSLLNVTFDPTVKHEFASYAFDDCGHHATKEYLIKDGVLLRGLGSLESQARLKSVPGVANFRSASWNRAPIDRMANINIEPGSTSLAEMISKTKKGVFMQANRSWSIDDYRNKFQFGCEFGQLIEDGKLTKIVKNPNYRGSTLSFWNQLKYVGRKEEFEIFGSPYCGKGEPSQIIRVGHASPPCLFSNIEVFGGGK